ncbi:hypothetical protein NQ315_006305, partial [Exocentrus adspersus]
PNNNPLQRLAYGANNRIYHLAVPNATPEKNPAMKEQSDRTDQDSDILETYFSLDVKETTNGRPQPLLQEPHYGSRPQPYSVIGNVQGVSENSMQREKFVSGMVGDTL